MNFRQAALIMIGSSSAAQLITILASPILARLYLPGDFGALATFLSISSIAGIVCTLRTERKIISANDEKNALLYFFASVKIAFLVSMLTTLIVLFLSVVKVVRIPVTYVPLVFIFTFSFGVLQSSILLASRYQRYSLIAKSALLRASFVVILQICFFYYLPSKPGIIFGAVSGLLISVFFITSELICFKKIRSYLSESTELSQPRDYKVNAFLGGIHALSSSLSNNVPIIIISTLGGFAEAGVYMMAERLVRMPINMISNNLRNVIAGKLQSDRQNAHSFILKLAACLCLLGIVVSAIIYFSADWLFVFFLGEQWHESSQVAKIMLLWIVFNLLSLPFQTYNLNFGKMSWLVNIELAFVLLKFVLLGVIYHLGYGVTEAALTISIASSLYYISNILVYKKNRNNSTII